jgi:hypothetical protein
MWLAQLAAQGLLHPVGGHHSIHTRDERLLVPTLFVFELSVSTTVPGQCGYLVVGRIIGLAKGPYASVTFGGQTCHGTMSCPSSMLRHILWCTCAMC